MRGTYSVRTYGHMQRKWCRHCTYNANDSPSFVFIASQKTQSESHDKINWRPSRHCVEFIFPKYPPYFAAMYISQQVEIISSRWYSISVFCGRINGASNPSIIVYFTICLLSKHRSRAQDVQWIESRKIRRRNVEVATKVPVAVCTRCIKHATRGGG